ncbi:MAG: hypothetical protein ACOX9R_05345 [Armatimonadota bacterium]|jgi:hypothetical protein
MTRQAASHRKSAPTPRVSSARRVWSDLIQPALIIGMIGAGAVVYLWACARVSVIECDLRRLERAGEAQQAVELQLQQHLASVQNAERIQAHIVEHQLDRPCGTRHVHLTDVPAALYEVLPTADSDRDSREIRLGELPGGADAPLHVSGRQLASARVQ